ncbi:MAG: pyruvate kinase [Candidatus Absconditabacterales bacterium]
MKLTKIIATVGPATWTEEKIIALYKSGVNVIRMNFSHKDYDEKKMVIDLVRKLNAEDKTKLSLLLDNKGPEIRTGKKEEKTHYEKDEMVRISINADKVDARDIFCDYPYLLEDLKVGDIIKVDSGLFDVEVVEIGSDYCTCKALSSALIGSYRHINLPGKKIKLPGLTDQDKEDMLFGIANKINIVAMSFVRSAAHIQELRQFRRDNGGGEINIIAKIENEEGLNNLNEIVRESDGVMVARGDLGIEVPITMLPVYQEHIMNVCHAQGKPVIVATQMIESMMKEPFPTRAEIHDIYQAVEMGTDCTMLSGETAIGSYPIEAVQFMKQTIQTAEQYKHKRIYNFSDADRDHTKLRYKYLVKSAMFLAKNIDAAGIVIFTKTGNGARLLSAYKSNLPILTCTWDPDVLEKLGYYYGVIAHKIDGKPQVDFERISKQFPIVDNPDDKPFVLISDTDKVAGNYPTIQVINK